MIKKKKNPFCAKNGHKPLNYPEQFLFCVVFPALKKEHGKDRTPLI